MFGRMPDNPRVAAVNTRPAQPERSSCRLPWCLCPPRKLPTHPASWALLASKHSQPLSAPLDCQRRHRDMPECGISATEQRAAAGLLSWQWHARGAEWQLCSDDRSVFVALLTLEM